MFPQRPKGGKASTKIVTTDTHIILFSYARAIVLIRKADYQVYLDERYHNLTITTTKHRNKFLNLNSPQVKSLITSGVFLLIDIEKELDEHGTTEKD